MDPKARPAVTSENRRLLKDWVQVIIQHSWMLPHEEATEFIDNELAKLEEDFGVELRWNEIRTVEISYPDVQEEEPVKPHLRLVR